MVAFILILVETLEIVFANKTRPFEGKKAFLFQIVAFSKQEMKSDTSVKDSLVQFARRKILPFERKLFICV